GALRPSAAAIPGAPALLPPIRNPWARRAAASPRRWNEKGPHEAALLDDGAPPRAGHACLHAAARVAPIQLALVVAQHFLGVAQFLLQLALGLARLAA